MAKVLTAAAVEKIKPDASGRVEIPDKLLTGLYLVVQPSGRKSWAVRYRLNGRSCKFTIGKLGTYGLADAREEAKAILRAVSEGRSPAVEKRQAKAAAAVQTATAETIEDAAKQFVQRYCRAKKLRSWRDTARRLGLKSHKEENEFTRTGKGVVKDWDGRLIHDIKRRDVRARIDAIAADHPVSANSELATLRKFFGWCVEQDMMTENPCTNIRRPSEVSSRDRVLSDAELEQVWLASGKLAYPFGPFVQLLILTGQRRTEVAEMRWREIDVAAKVWTIPRERRKNDEVQIVPLSDSALAIFEKLPRIKGEQGFVFTSAGTAAISGFSKAKKELDDIISEGRHEMAPWTLHDLRRTLATGLQRLGVRLEVTEAVLGHTSGSRAGIVGIYQRHDWKSEKRAALGAWAQHVLAVIACKADEQKADEGDEQNNIVYLKAARP